MVSFLWRIESGSYLVSRVCFSDHWRRYPEKKVISLHHRCCSQEGSGAGLRESLQSNSTLSNNNFFHRLECQKARKESEARPSDSKLGAFHSAKAYSGDEQKPGSFQPEETASSSVSSANCLSLTHLLPF